MEAPPVLTSPGEALGNSVGVVVILVLVACMVAFAVWVSRGGARAGADDL